MTNFFHLLSISFIVGFVGDALIQIGAKLGLGGSTGWGLNSYFKQHGSAESLFIAGGMMTLFYIIYLYLLPFKINYINLAIYGLILDIIFRKLRLFRSLDGYYKYLNYFWTGFWGAIPLMMPLAILNFISITNK
jgi:hypothetical protein